MLGGARTDLSGLTAPEAQALFLLLGPASSLVPEARSGLRKLVRALPETFRVEAQAAATAVVVDPTRWGEQARDRPALVRVLQDAVVRRRKVRLRYAGRSSRLTERLVDPWGLVDKDDTWYLVAGTEDGQRTFRVDRMIEAAVTDMSFQRPDGLDLPEVWDRVVAEVEQRRSQVWATVLLDPGLLWVLRAQFGRHCDVDDPVDGAVDDPVAAAVDRRVRARVAAPTAISVAEHLAGWGALITVEGPASVQAELARIGRELTERYPT